MSDMSQKKRFHKKIVEFLLIQARNSLSIKNYDCMFLFSIFCLSLDDNI